MPSLFNDKYRPQLDMNHKNQSAYSSMLHGCCRLRRMKLLLVLFVLMPLTFLFLSSSNGLINDDVSSQLSLEQKIQQQLDTEALQPSELRSKLQGCLTELHQARSELESKKSSASPSHSILHSNKAEHAEPHKHPLIIVTIATMNDMPRLRELVGSLHYLRENNLDVHQVIIYGLGLGNREKNEIRLWRNVDVIDGDDLGGKTLSLHHEQQQQPLGISFTLILNALEVNLRKYERVVYLRNDVAFKEDSLHRMVDVIDQKDLVLILAQGKSASTLSDHYALDDFIGLGFRSFTDAAKILVHFELQCIRQFQCDPSFRRALGHLQTNIIKTEAVSMQEYNMELFQENQINFFCHLLLRDDILYPFELGNAPANAKSNNKTCIAIGMPTLTTASLDAYEEVAPIRVFLPTFLSTVKFEEWNQFRYVFYIGYDEGDRFFDHAETRQSIEERLKDMVRKGAPAGAEVEFELIRFPYSKGWVTYLWNGLFIHAMKDGCDYFYQVNDDLQLSGEGWSTGFVSALKSKDDIGVTGPSDPFHNGGLLTQSFTSRKHYEIFGRYYPIDIKDWYSDNWINEVYGEEYTYRLKDYIAKNLNDQGTRYHVCSKPRFKEALQEGRNILSDYFEDRKRASEEVEDEEKGVLLTRRLQRELERGPLLR